MVSTFIQIAVVVAGLAIFAGLYLLDFIPAKGRRTEIITLAIVVAAAFVIAAIDRFMR
jgi:hypothetical protein